VFWGGTTTVSMRYIRPLIFMLALVPLMAFTMPHQAHAANATFFGPLVPQECHCDNQTGPDGKPISTAPAWGCILQVVQNCINLLISLSIVLLILYLAFAGAQLVTSAGSPSAREQGRQRVMNVIIGLVVVLSAWLIVDFVMKTLYNDKDSAFGPWNAILAGSDDSKCLIAHNPSGVITGSIGIVQGTGPGVTVGGGTFTGAGTNYSYDPGVRNQLSTASGPLTVLLTCMASKLPPGAGRISSISDNKISSGQATFQQCAVSGHALCSHTNYSCHYGGRKCIGSSYAVDFGDQENAAAITAAGHACAATAIYNEGNHLHVSVGKGSGCVCDD